MASYNSIRLAFFFEWQFLDVNLADAPEKTIDQFREALKYVNYYHGGDVPIRVVDRDFLRSLEARLRERGFTKQKAAGLQRCVRDISRAARLWLGDRREEIKAEEKQQRAGRRHRAQQRREALQQLPVLPQFAVAAEQLGLTGGDELCGSAMVDARWMLPSVN